MARSHIDLPDLIKWHKDRAWELEQQANSLMIKADDQRSSKFIRKRKTDTAKIMREVAKRHRDTVEVMEYFNWLRSIP